MSNLKKQIKKYIEGEVALGVHVIYLPSNSVASALPAVSGEAKYVA